MLSDREIAKREIEETFRICNFCTRNVGISLIDDIPDSLRGRMRTYLSMFMTSLMLTVMLTSEYIYIAGRLMMATSIADFVGSNLHITGFGTMSFGKLITIWSMRYTFRQLVVELADIWPVSMDDREAVVIKEVTLSTLKYTQQLYAYLYGVGVWIYNLTPIGVLIYYKLQGISSQLGYVYQLSYPFDKTKPIYHELAYIFETCAGILSVFCMLGTDLLFMTMASHISMLLRLLQRKIRNLIPDDVGNVTLCDCYAEIVDVVKIHQRLIRYIQDLENAFSVVNLINVLLSSINICCVMFNIVFLDPWLELSNKFYIISVLAQMGIICWYADDIYRASIGVADAVYESKWYSCDERCRRALLLLLQRAQKPLYFTTMKFSTITLTTYTSILTTAYSYFTLLYTAYRQN